MRILISAMILLMVSGCATFSGQTDSSGAAEKEEASLSVAKLLKFDDIPVPAGFKIMDAESFAFQNDKSRVALLKYIGGKRADIVVEFYKEQMAAYNWDAINIVEYEKRVMNYENSYESCIVTIEPRGGKSVIIISLSPKSRPMKAEKGEK
ncbi:MAG: hypothetical protein WC569_02005 [Candidatus Omnitrophota bacterium]